MAIIEIDNTTKVEIYKDLILKRDRLKKEAFQYQEEYFRVFGDLITESYSLKIDCIRLKKQIAYCQLCVNQNMPINQTELDAHIESIMAEYNEELQDLILHVNISKTATSISHETLLQIKKIYRKIAKKIHPDMNPQAFEREDIQELWNRTVLAYSMNDLEELKNIEVLVDLLEIDENTVIEIEDIEERISKLEDEIQNILDTEPYQFKYLLESKEEIEDRKDELKDEIKQYQDYKRQLEQIYAQFDIQTILN